MGGQLTLIRDARIHSEKQLDSSNREVVLRGRIISCYGRSNKVTFYGLRDVSETIQILVERTTTGEDIWASFKAVSIGASVEVRGTVGLSRTGKISLFPSAQLKILTLPDEADLLTEDLGGVGTQIVLARLEHRVRSFLTVQGFVELSARYLSSAWSEGGLQPLRVHFPGQSVVPLFLAVSPLPKLLTAAFAVGQGDFFCISRSFATNFVATQNGAESVLAGSISFDRSLDDCCDLSLTLLKGLLASSETAVDLDLWNEMEIPYTRSQGATLTAPRAPTGLHLHFGEHLDGVRGLGGFTVTHTFQIAWRRDLFLAEGFSLKLGRGLDVQFFVVYVERFLRLLRMQDNRRIRDLLHPVRTRQGEHDVGAQAAPDAV